MPLRSCLLSRTLCCCLILTLLAGCGGGEVSGLVPVTGQVTLDGEPLAGALVAFRKSSGRPVTGITDDDGRYELRYARGQLGAKPGVYQVSIRTDSGDVAGDAGEATEEATEEVSEGGVVVQQRTERTAPLPPRYNDQTELTADVSESSTTFDFALESDPAE